MIPRAVPEALLCLLRDPSPGHGQSHEHSWEQGAAAPSPGAFPCSGGLHSQLGTARVGTSPVRVAGPAQPIPLSVQVVQPGAVSGGRGVGKGQLQERGRAPGQRPGVREQPALSARSPGSLTRWVAIQKKNPPNPQVPANSSCGGMSRSTRGQIKSFRSDPHLPRAEIHGFEVS